MRVRKRLRVILHCKLICNFWKMVFGGKSKSSFFNCVPPRESHSHWYFTNLIIRFPYLMLLLFPSSSFQSCEHSAPKTDGKSFRKFSENLNFPRGAPTNCFSVNSIKYENLIMKFMLYIWWLFTSSLNNTHIFLIHCVHIFKIIEFIFRRCLFFNNWCGERGNL